MIQTISTPSFYAAQKQFNPTVHSAHPNFVPQNILKNDTFTKSQPTLQFNGYGPSALERSSILTALQGTNTKVFGPNYLPSLELVNGLSERLQPTQTEPLQSAFLNELAQKKQEAINLHHFLLNKPLASFETTLAEAQTFDAEVKNRVNRILNESLTPQAGFSPEMRQAFTRFVALTAPVIFTMGFADGVDHAGDVSQLALTIAKKQGANTTEQLQAAMVGWLHDPKLKGDISWSNLATHPVVASAISDWVFQDNTFKSVLNAGITSQNLTPETFQQGVREALAINNDSAFVMNNVILANTFKHPLGEPGLAEQVPVTREWMHKRFKAPSKNESLPVLPREVETELEQQGVSLSTDLRTITRQALSQIIGSPEVATIFYQQLVTGQITDETKLAQVREQLKGTPNGITSPKASATSLLAHHEDVENGKVAAMALTVADPLLLSPHKIIESSFEETLGKRVRSFLNSFAANVTFLPQAQKAIGKLWQKELLDSMLKAVGELTGRQVLPALAQDAPIEDAIQVRDALLQGDLIWTVPQEPSDDPVNKPKNMAELSLKGDAKLAKEMAGVFKKAYESALKQSKALSA
jgi:hypothetical protein